MAGEKAEAAGVSRDLGVGPRAGQMQGLGLREERQRGTSGEDSKRGRWLVSGAGVKK